MKETMATAERAHHPMSPSNWPAWSRCPHFQGGVKSVAADDGTLQHEAYANAVKNGVDEYDAGGPAWAARETLAMSGGCELHVEDKIEIESDIDDLIVKTYGYADCWFVKDDVLHVVDFKSGGKTAVDYWPQLEGYASGIAGSVSADTQVKLHILYGADFLHETLDTTVGACRSDAAFVIAQRIYRTDSDRETCPQCKWCANRGSCPAVSTAIENVDTDTHPAVALPDAVLLDRFAIIEGIIKAEKERIRENAIANGGFVESGDIRYEMKETAGSRKSVDIRELVNDFVKTTGLTLSDYDLIRACDISKKAFVDLVRDSAKAGGVKIKQIEDIYNSHVERNPPTQKLVRVSK